jgi:dihydroxyacid dehydratase/phosphogluconate dehydratase
MLRAVDFTDEDFAKPIITVACPFTNATPCNDHIRELGDILSRSRFSSARPSSATGRRWGWRG